MSVTLKPIMLES